MIMNVHFHSGQSWTSLDDGQRRLGTARTSEPKPYILFHSISLFESQFPKWAPYNNKCEKSENLERKRLSEKLVIENSSTVISSVVIWNSHLFRMSFSFLWSNQFWTKFFIKKREFTFWIHSGNFRIDSANESGGYEVISELWKK